jgi:bifunctional non-homologous end joining protein LigD
MSEATVGTPTRTGAVRESMPSWVSPMLATLTDRRFSDPDWIYERKLDGERCLAFRRRDRVDLRTRTRTRINDHYPEVAEALQEQPAHDLVVDGEIVAFDRGRMSFSRLQRRMHVSDPTRARETGVTVYLYLFDLLYLDGYDVTPLPLRDRKSLLKRTLRFGDPLRFTPHRVGEGERYLEEACRKGWEGVIAKRWAAPYVGRRSGDWLKFKCVQGQELVVGGYTDPQGSREQFGALLVGYYEDNRLVYAGKVGTGFDRDTLRDLGKRLVEVGRPTSPFTAGPVPTGTVHWVEPTLVAQVGFAEWTRDGRLRHSRFLGLRDDKAPTDVVRERPR